LSECSNSSTLSSSASSLSSIWPSSNWWGFQQFVCV
jgi:hypothetical protein